MQLIKMSESTNHLLSISARGPCSFPVARDMATNKGQEVRSHVVHNSKNRPFLQITLLRLLLVARFQWQARGYVSSRP
jgi:hypothetical protein